MTAEPSVRPSPRLPGLLTAFGLIGGATLVANFAAAVSIILLAPLIHTRAEHEMMQQVISPVSGATLTLASFLVPSLLATLYILPVYRICFLRQLDASLPLAQRRLLNMPLVLGIIGLCGWLINVVSYFGEIPDPTPEVPLVILGYILDNIFTGSLVFVISYYLLEFISRKYFIPAFFPQGKLSACKGTLELSIQGRFFIFFFAVCIVPIFLMYRLIRAVSGEGGASSNLTTILLITIIVLLLGALLAYLISRSYQVPLVEMARAAQHIQASDYAVHIAVVSNDEVGELGEAMNEMAVGLKEKEFIKDTFGKVVDPRVRDHLLAGHIALGGETREAAILFSDIRDFTAISAQMKPDKVVEWLNVYFERMTQCIVEEGGIVNKYVGDAILAVFGVPIELENPTAAAYRAAVRMKEAKAVLNMELEGSGLPSVHSGIAIHTGPVLAGNIGSSSRMEYTVIGDTVNVAARMEKLCKEYGRDILLSESAVAQLGNSFPACSLGLADIRGKDQPVQLYA